VRKGPGVRFLDDLTRIEQQLTEARDALIAYWEQPEGQACFLALRIAEDAMADYRVLNMNAAQQRDAGEWQRLRALADEVMQLRAPLEGTL
jgi:hypothetical protein